MPCSRLFLLISVSVAVSLRIGGTTASPPQHEVSNFILDFQYIQSTPSAVRCSTPPPAASITPLSCGCPRCRTGGCLNHPLKVAGFVSFSPNEGLQWKPSISAPLSNTHDITWFHVSKTILINMQFRKQYRSTSQPWARACR